jgi:hypothetical protein
LPSHRPSQVKAEEEFDSLGPTDYPGANPDHFKGTTTAMIYATSKGKDKRHRCDRYRHMMGRRGGEMKKMDRVTNGGAAQVALRNGYKPFN